MPPPPKFVAGTEVTLPKGARGVMLAGFPGGGRGASVSIERIEGSRTATVSHIVEPWQEGAAWGEPAMTSASLLLSKQPLRPGSKYRFKGPGGLSLLATVASTPLPRRKLPLHVGADGVGPVELSMSMVCSATVTAASRTVRVELPPALKKLERGLLFHTIIDGKVWRPSDSMCSDTAPGRSSHGIGEEVAFAVCESGPFRDRGLTEKKSHWVEMRIELPGSGTVLETERKTFALDCSAPAKPPPERPTDPAASADPSPASHGEPLPPESNAVAPNRVAPGGACGCEVGPMPTRADHVAGLALLLALTGALRRRTRLPGAGGREASKQ